MIDSFPALVSAPAAYIIAGVCVAAVLLFRIFEWRYFRRHHNPTLRRKVYWWSSAVGF